MKCPHRNNELKEKFTLEYTDGNFIKITDNDIGICAIIEMSNYSNIDTSQEGLANLFYTNIDTCKTVFVDNEESK